MIRRTILKISDGVFSIKFIIEKMNFIRKRKTFSFISSGSLIFEIWGKLKK